MYKQNQALVELLSPAVKAMGYEMLGLEHHAGGRGASLLRVYIDSVQGIGVDDCARVNRQVESLLDVHEPLVGGFRLEVSSPGLDRPLFTLDQFQRFIGRRVRIKTRESVDGRRNFTGRIGAVAEGSVSLQADDEQYDVAEDNIGWARLVPDV